MTYGTRCGLALLLATQGLTGRPPARPSTLEAQLQRAGLVDVRRLDPSIRVELKYSSVDNFMHADVYGDLERCYLQKEVAVMLVQAQRWLKQRHPRFSLHVFDGARPRRVQKIMWQLVKDSEQRKYVADPALGSIHNFGSAVDLTIADEQGTELDMGTSYDFLGELAQPRYEARFLQAGQLTTQQVEHRKLLRDTMLAAGFVPISNEWWHFDAFSRSVAKARYAIIE
jgi:D-alanyl-D-alanine dipeptidase